MDRLGPGRCLSVGQALSSPSGEHRLRLGDDGDLVLQTAAGRWRWSTATADLPVLERPTTVVLQADGDLVLRSATGAPRWSAGTAGLAGLEGLAGLAGTVVTQPSLVLGDDGSLAVVVEGEVPLWTADSTAGGAGVRYTVDRDVAAAQRIRVTGLLGVDGLLLADVVTANRDAAEVLRGRALAVVHGEQDRPIWVSGVFAAATRGPVEHGPGGWGACGGQEPWHERFPAVVGRHARRVEVLLARSRAAPVSLQRVRQRIVDDLTGNGDPGCGSDLAHAWTFLFT